MHCLLLAANRVSIETGDQLEPGPTLSVPEIWTIPWNVRGTIRAVKNKLKTLCYKFR